MTALLAISTAISIYPATYNTLNETMLKELFTTFPHKFLSFRAYL